MTFKGDIHQTRVKNSSFGIPKFSVNLHSIYIFFLLLERAYQDAGHDVALFSKLLVFMWEKKGIS
jgi:hypothetical protein